MRRSIDYTLDTSSEIDARLKRWVPPAAAVVLVVAFARLGFWQLDRAAEKEALADLFAAERQAAPLAELEDPELYRPAEVRGRYLPGRQVLVDNIVVAPRVGYYVITPLETRSDQPLLLVNRGWIAKPARGEDLPDLDVDPGPKTIPGRVGRLPRVGIRGDEAFAGDDGWPRIAVYPTAAEIGAELGREVRPWILLLDPAAPDGFYRDWRPRESGPMTHYGYAFQWFALCLAVIAVSAWRFRRRRS